MTTRAKQEETAAELEREIQLQSEANEDFFVNLPRKVMDLENEELEKKCLPDDLKRFNGKFFNITGWDASKVVALLSCIVNTWKIKKTFYLLLNEPDCNQPLGEVFRLKANPTENQPGNGFVVMRPSGKKEFPEAKKYDAITGVIAAYYENDKERFWEDLQKLFQDNSAGSIPDITVEVYLLLLFEIARRLVRKQDRKPSEAATAGEREAFDCLPVGVAIARMLVIKPSFRKVFLIREDFDCFSVRYAAERRDRIINLNKAFRNDQGVGLKSKKGYLEELENAFIRPEIKQVSVYKARKPCTDFSDKSDELCFGFQDLRLCDDTFYRDYDICGEFSCCNHDYGDDNPFSVCWFCNDCNKEFYSLTQYDADEIECPCCFSSDVSSC